MEWRRICKARFGKYQGGEEIQMKASQIYAKTMKFVWAKLLLGLVTTLISIVLLALFTWIGSLFSSGGVFISFLLWLAVTGIVYNIINRYFGYMIKAGHVAIIATAVTTGQIPENQMEAAKTMVKERFATSNVYFAVDSLVGGAVRQLQRGLDKVDNTIGKLVPGASYVIQFAKVFIGIALGYVDECCLGYTFIKKEQGAFKSACDGVVIYFQNWKTLLKNAAKMALVVVIVTALAWIIPFAVFGAIFKAVEVSMVFAFFIALIVALFLKSAFVDSYMMVKMMVSYMEVAPSTEITFDLYDKLCKLSSKFKSLFKKSEEEKGAQA